MSVLDDIDALAAERSARELCHLQDQIERSGGCEHPIRLRAEGAGSPSLGQPDGVILVACKSRRETRCRPCSVTYRADAKQIVRTGIEGGKGVPGTVSGHPSVFLTLTAPSFGPVHRAIEGRCHLGAPGHCEHGRLTHCLEAHRDEDEAVGSPLCPDCYDYEAAVVFNATVGELWRRVTIYAKRHLAYALRLTETELSEAVRLSYVKVAELQRRGVVHLHAIVRADAKDDEVLPPALGVTVGVLAEALVTATRAVSVTREVAGRSFTCSFGEQVRTEALEPDAMAKLAGYLSKYLVKEASGNGALDHRLRDQEIELLDVPDHLRRILETAWHLGGSPETMRFRRWAHALGFSGHVMTKSRRYSTTFLALRALRQAWRVAERGEEQVPDSAAEDLVWVFTGAGFRKEIDALLARTYWQGRARARAEYWANWHEKHGDAA